MEGFGNGLINFGDSKRIRFSVGVSLIQDESIMKSYTIEKFRKTPQGYHSMFGSITPSFALGYRDSFTFRDSRFAQYVNVGFQPSDQLYLGEYFKEIDDGMGGVIAIPDGYERNVKKYYMFLSTGVQIKLNKLMFVGPSFMVDYRVKTRISEQSVKELLLFNVYDRDKNKLRFHPPVNVKVGLELGTNINRHIDFRLGYRYGLFRSITVEPNYNWYNFQLEAMLSYTL